MMGWPTGIASGSYQYNNYGYWELISRKDFGLPRKIIDFSKYRVTDNINDWAWFPQICKCGKEKCWVNNRVKELAQEMIFKTTK
jgi:hypothetical protein